MQVLHGIHKIIGGTIDKAAFINLLKKHNLEGEMSPVLTSDGKALLLINL